MIATPSVLDRKCINHFISDFFARPFPKFYRGESAKFGLDFDPNCLCVTFVSKRSKASET